jgi:hypothetical protein
MLDAGVPLTTSVAGVAMGLILGEKEGDEPGKGLLKADLHVWCCFVFVL